MTKNSEQKLKAFFSTLKALSFARNFLRPESASCTCVLQKREIAPVFHIQTYATAYNIPSKTFKKLVGARGAYLNFHGLWD